MKKLLTITLVITLLVASILTLTACDNKKEDKKTASKTSETEKQPTKNESSDIIDVESLSDEEKIEHTLFGLLRETYGDDFGSAKIYVDKMYKAEDAEKDEVLKELNLGEKEIAFEVSMDIEPAEGADVMQFTIPDGEYNEETGWVNNISRLGVLRYDAASGIYSIDHYGTGW